MQTEIVDCPCPCARSVCIKIVDAQYNPPVLCRCSLSSAQVTLIQSTLGPDNASSPMSPCANCCREINVRHCELNGCAHPLQASRHDSACLQTQTDCVCVAFMNTTRLRHDYVAFMNTTQLRLCCVHEHNLIVTPVKLKWAAQTLNIVDLSQLRDILL